MNDRNLDQVAETDKPCIETAVKQHARTMRCSRTQDALKKLVLLCNLRARRVGHSATDAVRFHHMMMNFHAIFKHSK